MDVRITVVMYMISYESIKCDTLVIIDYKRGRLYTRHTRDILL